MNPKIKLIIVGLILMKYSSLNAIDNPQKIPSNIAEKVATFGTCLDTAKQTNIAIKEVHSIAKVAKSKLS